MLKIHLGLALAGAVLVAMEWLLVSHSVHWLLSGLCRWLRSTRPGKVGLRRVAGPADPRTCGIGRRSWARAVRPIDTLRASSHGDPDLDTHTGLPVGRCEHPYDRLRDRPRFVATPATCDEAGVASLDSDAGKDFGRPERAVCCSRAGRSKRHVNAASAWVGTE
jgi:hypothetical protein